MEKRRKEIKEEWMSLIGEWPPVITNQKFEIINTLKREDFINIASVLLDTQRTD